MKECSKKYKCGKLKKFFTTIINLRLNIFLNLNNILLEKQTGFRKGYSTLNHVFSLKSLIDIFFSKKKNITVPLSISKKHSILFGGQVYG